MDEAAEVLGGSAIPYVSELLPGSPAFSTKIFVAQGHATLSTRVSTTGAMRVDSYLPDNCFVLVFDVRKGIGIHRSTKQSVFVDSHVAFIQSPLQRVEVLTNPDFDALFLRLSRDAVVQELQKSLGREIGSALQFSPVCRLQSAAGHRLYELYESLWRLLCRSSDPGVANSLPVQTLEGEIITLLLQTQPNNYTRLLNRGCDAGAWQLRAAEEFMRANAHQPISLGDICLAAGVNARSLQYAFSRKRACHPMQFLRNIRMQGVRRALLHPSESASVATEAARWCFLHFGRFSHEYRVAFGELPSETLRRSEKKKDKQPRTSTGRRANARKVK